jgi:hypothetical protein
MSRDLAPVFAELRATMLAAVPPATVTRDDPGHLELAGPGLDPKTGGPDWFGMVRTGARAVGYHLMGIYSRPGLAAELSPALAKRRQGKSCFNFSAIDRSLFSELAELTRRCAKEAP